VGGAPVAAARRDRGAGHPDRAAAGGRHLPRRWREDAGGQPALPGKRRRHQRGGWSTLPASSSRCGGERATTPTTRTRLSSTRSYGSSPPASRKCGSGRAPGLRLRTWVSTNRAFPRVLPCACGHFANEAGGRRGSASPCTRGQRWSPGGSALRVTCRRATPVPFTPGLAGSQRLLTVFHVTLTWLAPL
jgi:hypothetical protein